MEYTLKEKVTITAWVISFNDESIEFSRRKFSESFNKPAPPRSTLQDWKKKLLETGNLVNDRPRSGRPVSASGDDVTTAVLHEVRHESWLGVMSRDCNTGITETGTTGIDKKYWIPKTGIQVFRYRFLRVFFILSDLIFYSVRNLQSITSFQLKVIFKTTGSNSFLRTSISCNGWHKKLTYCEKIFQSEVVHKANASTFFHTTSCEQLWTVGHRRLTLCGIVISVKTVYKTTAHWLW